MEADGSAGILSFEVLHKVHRSFDVVVTVLRSPSRFSGRARLAGESGFGRISSRKQPPRALRTLRRIGRRI